jgi:hypothetical protein
MLKTNSKKARENIRSYIVDHFNPCGYEVNQEPETFEEIAKIILETFAEEKPYSTKYIYRYCLSDEKVFMDWAAGLPTILDTCYYYNRSAVDDLGAILEETESEKARYTESDAERLLTHLIFRELMKGAEKK